MARNSVSRILIALAAGILLVLGITRLPPVQSAIQARTCTPNNGKIHDSRLRLSTYLDVPPLTLTAVRVPESGGPYLADGTSILRLTANGSVRNTYSMPGQVMSLVADAQGSLFATGELPTTRGFGSPPAGVPLHRYGKGGSGDVYVVKLSPAGKIIYRTDLGGTNSEYGTAIAVDEHGDALVAALTTSDDLPLLHPFERHYHGPSMRTLPPQGAAFPQDAWVMKLDPEGRLLASSYLGGSENDEIDTIQIDAQGRAVLFGWTASPDFSFTRPLLLAPSRTGHSTAITFVARLTASGRSLLSATPIYHDASLLARNSMAIDRAGHIIIIAGTGVMELDSRVAHVLQRTSLGKYAEPRSLALDSAGNAEVTGVDQVGAIRVVRPLQSHFHRATCGHDESIHNCTDAFVAQLDPSGRITFNSYFGGSRDDEGDAILAGEAGRIDVLGTTSSADFPLVHAGTCSLPSSDSYDQPVTGFFTEMRPG